MGNPASPIIANIVMNNILSSLVSKLSFPIPLLKLYVDDTIMTIPKSKVDLVLTNLNSFHPKLKFTYEIEENSQITFLDTIIIRKDSGQLQSNWHIKPYSSERLLNFKSNHPLHMKSAIIMSLFHRATKLSHQDYHKENINKVKSLLQKNNYPKHFINQIYTRFQNYNTRPTQQTEIKKYVKFPYIKEISHKIAKLFKPYNYQLAFYNTRTIRELFTNLKDSTPLSEKSSIVYKIPCKNCSSCYIGQTKQYAKCRIKQHNYDCAPKNFNKIEKTALADHHFVNDHVFDFDAFKILDTETNFKKRNISEMIHIQINNTINKRTDTDNLSKIYTFILDKFKNRH